MEVASKIGESYIALREISLKLRSSFPYRSYRLPGYFFAGNPEVSGVNNGKGGKYRYAAL